MMRRRLAAMAAISASLLAAQTTSAQDAPRLDSPVACPADFGCVVRNFLDQDPGPEAHDQNCGNLTYDGHKGVDIRVPDSNALMRGVEVRAAAAGVVVGVRDEMPDISVRLIDRSTIENRAGGNLVVIDHGNDWKTFYWHLRRGSIKVTPGEKVDAGQPLGLIGISGDTEFLHLHFEIRHGDTRFDPYSGLPLGSGCGKAAEALWTDAAAKLLPYRAEAPFDAGFATEKVDFNKAHAGGYAAEGLGTDIPALVFWAEAIGTRVGDEETIRLIGPDGTVIVGHTGALTKIYVANSRFIGDRRPVAGWTAGVYRGEYIVRRMENGESRTVVEITREIELR